MTNSSAPRIARIGFAAALALGLLETDGADAVAAVISDSLQVGNQGATLLIEGTEGPANAILESALITETGQTIIGTRVIVLAEPGITAISDIVAATITPTATPTQFEFSIVLTSDIETPLSPPTIPIDLTIAETGAVQDLTLAFHGLFDLNDTNPLPSVLVMSDVPEPTSFAILAAGLVGLGLVRRRRRVSRQG